MWPASSPITLLITRGRFLHDQRFWGARFLHGESTLMGGERKVNRGNHTIWGVWSHTFFCVVPHCKFRNLSNSTFWPCPQRPVLQVIPLVTKPSGQRCLRPATSHLGFLATHHLL